MLTDTTLAQLIDLSVRLTQYEVVRDIRRGIFLASDIEGFGDLHSYVDANCYGGLCDEAVSALFGSTEADNAQWLIGFGGAVQDRVHAWLLEGGHHDGACTANESHICANCDREGCDCHVRKSAETGEHHCAQGQGCNA